MAAPMQNAQVITPWPRRSGQTRGTTVTDQTPQTNQNTAQITPEPARPSRRNLLAVAGLVAAGVSVTHSTVGLAEPAAPTVRNAGPGAGRRLPTNLFTLGVASGDPLPDGIVLWTRLAPRPLDGGGMPAQPVLVEWELAEDERFVRVSARGSVVTRPDRAHSVHVDVRGLASGRPYFYRFRAGGEISPAGRTLTAPATDASPRHLRYAIASCQNYQDGYFGALAHLADEPDLSFVAFLGDYIYESAPNPRAVRVHQGTGEPVTLTDYRNRHGQYRSDPDLQAAHATHPWIVTIDDHDVDNNWAGMNPQDPWAQSLAAFRARRAAAFEAYYEHMPLRRDSTPHGPNIRLYRRMRFGGLTTVHVLDTRQYRSGQPTSLAQADDPSLTMTGPAQERWLVRGMSTSDTRWNLVANQVMWAQNDRRAGPDVSFDLDNWDGYRVQRRRLLEFFGSGATRNPVVLTGDRHRTWVCDLKPDFDDPRSPVVGAELTGTSISSGGDEDNRLFHAVYDPVMAESPHWKYIDARRGYLVGDLFTDRMEVALRTVDTVRRREGTTVRTAARFVVLDGRPGVAVDVSDAG